MPRPLMEALLWWLPILQAEDNLVAAQISMLPHLKNGPRKRVIRDWERVARVARQRVLTTVKELHSWLGEQKVGI
jgi:membrane carboxypeptidase/penicillin-binding protein PbpC